MVLLKDNQVTLPQDLPLLPNAPLRREEQNLKAPLCGYLLQDYEYRSVGLVRGVGYYSNSNCRGSTKRTLFLPQNLSSSPQPAGRCHGEEQSQPFCVLPEKREVEGEKGDNMSQHIAHRLNEQQHSCY